MAVNSLQGATDPISKAIIDAKGDLIVGTADNTINKFSLGTNGQVLKANSATATGLEWAAEAGIPATLLDAKGDLIVASAADTAARLAVGTNGHALLADSGATNGVKWGAVGKVLQVVSATKTDTFSMTGTTFTDVTGLSVTITPTATTSKILVFASVIGQGTAGITSVQVRLMRDSTAIAIGDAAGSRLRVFSVLYVNNSDYFSSGSIMHLDSPATTSATTYKVQIAGVSASGVNYINRTVSDSDNTSFSRAASNITVLEIGA